MGDFFLQKCLSTFFCWKIWNIYRNLYVKLHHWIYNSSLKAASIFDGQPFQQLKQYLSIHFIPCMFYLTFFPFTSHPERFPLKSTQLKESEDCYPNFLETMSKEISIEAFMCSFKHKIHLMTSVLKEKRNWNQQTEKYANVVQVDPYQQIQSRYL